MSDPTPQVVLDVAAELGVDPDRLDHHVEAEHGLEPHDRGYDDGVRIAAQCLTAGRCTAVRCTCTPPGHPPMPDQLHSVTCLTVATTQPHAMVDDQGQVFYPDSAIDAAAFALDHGARFLDPAAGAAWLAEVTDDPTPTTGAPEEHYFPEGCGCHIREDPEWGDVYAHPPGGCRVHIPWAFPGYSLTTDAGV